MACPSPTRCPEKNRNERNFSDGDHDSSENEGMGQTKTTFASIMVANNDEEMSVTDNFGDKESGKTNGSITQIGNGDRKCRSIRCPPIGTVKETRNTINRRERQRMLQLNKALDGLRAVMPSIHSSSSRKLSKIATLLSAKNYIQMLNKSIQDMSVLLRDLRRSTACISTNIPCIPHCVPTFSPSADGLGSSLSKPTGFVSRSNSYRGEVPTASALYVSPLPYQEYGQQVYFTNRSSKILEHHPHSVNQLHYYY
ncbi:neurogenic differentiation factor 1-like [Pecten maximus]|uniref:neurogenic differentiation factor 1-like n=1 Tax=Pecten maximus TaxID=6579 RepID=UPI001458E351|nr:neurogenic differentiation factor 1-like [Pecten maximus]